MPLTTYTAGEVLTAASLNANLSFAASSPAGGLTLISTTTIGTTVSSVAISSAFSSTYDNYRIIVSGGVASTGTAGYFYLGTGALPASGYYRFSLSGVYSGNTVTGNNTSNGAAWGGTFAGTTASLNADLEIYGPNLAKNTHFKSFASRSQTTETVIHTGGYLADTTQYTGFTFAPDSGTLTGGTVKVYGYANS